MIFPYSVDVPMERMPIANWLLIAVTILGSVMLLSSKDLEHTLVLWRGTEFRWIQLAGSLIGHADWMHLLGNMAFLFVFGNAINAKLGHVLYLVTYFAIGAIEGLVWLMLGSSEATLGASGAIMGVIGAFLVMYPRNDISVFYYFSLMYSGSFDVSAYWVILMYVCFDVWGLIRGDGAGVNYLAHFTGALAGFGIMWGLLAARVVQSDSDEQSLLEVLKEHATAPRKKKAGAAPKRRKSSGEIEEEAWRSMPAPSDAPPLPPTNQERPSGGKGRR